MSKVNVNDEQIVEFLSAGDYDKAGKSLQKVLDQDLTPMEIGASYTDFALMYMKAMNDINRRYLQFLNDSLAVSKEVNTYAQQKGDNSMLTWLRNKMKKN